jgi:secondary thiamine-phosphate synthase enzyme
MDTIPISTSQKEQIIDITDKVQEIVLNSKIKEGICVTYCPHTSAAIIINENADPDVKGDLLLGLKDIVKQLPFKHAEGNSAAHVKSALLGKSQQLLITDSKLLLGTWDGIMFCEFDGPRKRQVYVQCISK